MNADLLESPEEEALRRSVDRLLADRLSPQDLSAGYDGDVDHAPLWSALAHEIGITGLLVPESFGGLGGTVRDAAVVAEVLGSHVAPVPFLTSAVMATSALVRCGAGDVLPDLAEGRTTAVLAMPLSTPPRGPLPCLDVRDGRIHGRVTSVADGAVADLFLVPGRTSADRVDLYLVAATEVCLDPVVCLDMTRPLADLTFPGSAATVLAVDEDVESILSDVIGLGAGVLAAEQLGLARWCLTSTVEYVSTRYQFGRPIGSFQALKHRLADLWVQTVSATAAVRYAADCLTRGEDAATAVGVAQSYCAGLAVRAAEEAIQLHGGIGMTWEHPLHLYLKRAKASQNAWGSAEDHRARLGDLVGLDR